MNLGKKTAPWKGVFLALALAAVEVPAQSQESAPPLQAPPAATTVLSNEPPATAGTETNIEAVSPIVSTTFAPDTPDQTSGIANEINGTTGVVLPPQAQIGENRPGRPQPASPIMGTSVLASPGLAAGGSGRTIPIWGGIDIIPRLSYSLTYATGLEHTPGQSSSSFINSVTPGFTMDLGPHLSLTYSLGLVYYSNPVFTQSQNQNVLLQGSWHTEDWLFGLTQSYVQTSDPLVETGAQTSQDAYATTLTATRSIGSHFSVDVNASQSFRDAAAYDDVEEWEGTVWLNYQFSPALGAGVGVIGGYDLLSVGSDMPFENYQGRITFHPGTKLVLSVSGGIQARQFIGPDEPSLVSPIFSGSLSYQIFQATSISLSGSRSVNPSFFANEVETTTSIGVALRQQLTSKLSLQLSGGYSDSPLSQTLVGPQPAVYYIGTAPPNYITVSRDDTTETLSLSASYSFNPQLSTSVFATYSKNSSGAAAYAYNSSQVGISLSYRY